MRKILIAVLIIAVAALVSGMVYFSMDHSASRMKVQYGPNDEFELKFNLPVGNLLEYDVEIERKILESSKKGKLTFTVRAEMEQAMVNHKDKGEEYSQLHMDLYKDLTVLEAKLDKKPLDSETRSAITDNSIRYFKYNAYVFNETKMKYNGLPVELPDIEKETQLVNAFHTYIQYFPGDKRKVGDKWDFSKQFGEWSIKFSYSFDDLVYDAGVVCAQISGTAELIGKTDKIQYHPVKFTLWLSVDEGIVTSSELLQSWRTQKPAISTQIEMKVSKKLINRVDLEPALLAAVDKYAQEIVDNEKMQRKKAEERDMTKDAVRRAFFTKVNEELSATPFKRGLEFILELMK